MRQKIEDKINKTREELIERKLEKLIERKPIGKEDYQMANGDYTDRYETLFEIKEDDPFEYKYTIYELDKIKGTRITIIDKDTRKIIKETK